MKNKRNKKNKNPTANRRKKFKSIEFVRERIQNKEMSPYQIIWTSLILKQIKQFNIEKVSNQKNSTNYCPWPDEQLD